MDDVRKMKMTVDLSDLKNIIGELLGRVEILEEKMEKKADKKQEPSGVPGIGYSSGGGYPSGGLITPNMLIPGPGQWPGMPPPGINRKVGKCQHKIFDEECGLPASFYIVEGTNGMILKCPGIFLCDKCVKIAREIHKEYRYIKQ